jgi:hypothetical protein
MLNRMRPGRPSPATFIAMIALVGAFGGPALADDAVELAKKKLISGKKIKKRSIQGNRLKRNTLTGTEIRESKLGKVPTAKDADHAINADVATTAGNANAVNGVGQAQFTVGRSAIGSCDPSGASFVDCASVAFTLPRVGRVLVVADSTWHSTSMGIAKGTCEVALDGTNASGDVTPGQLQNNTDATHNASVGANLITDSLPAGSHTFTFRCNQTQNDMIFDRAFISAVMIGSA